MSRRNGYKQLTVYHDAHRLGVEIHRFSLQLPRHELYEIGSQIRRSSKSISANIVEGYGRRRFKADYIKHLTYAQASCDETTEWLEYIQDCHPALLEEAKIYLAEIESLGRRLNRFIQSVESNHDRFEPNPGHSVISDRNRESGIQQPEFFNQ